MLLCVSIPPQYLLRLVSLDGCGCEPNYVTPKLIFREPFVRMAINRNRINFMVMQIVAYDIRYTNMRAPQARYFDMIRMPGHLKIGTLFPQACCRAHYLPYKC